MSEEMVDFSALDDDSRWTPEQRALFDEHLRREERFLRLEVPDSPKGHRLSLALYNAWQAARRRAADAFDREPPQ